jgi:RNA ligase (TIGR02306 family)
MTTSSPPSTKSDFNVEVVRVRNLRPHPNADTLDVCEANGTPVIVKRGVFSEGGLAIFVPVDAIVPLSNPAFAFLRRHEGDVTARIRAVRLRGVYSEGLLVRPEEAFAPGVAHLFPLGHSVANELGITKYLSPADREEMTRSPQRTRERTRLENASLKFMPVYGVDSLRRFPDAIKVGTPIVVTEKIHGCNARYSYRDGKLWVGSHKTLRGVTRHRLLEAAQRLWLACTAGLGFAHRAETFQKHGDVWWQIAERLDLRTRLQHPSVIGKVVYGEVYGAGLQVRGGVRFDYDAPDECKFRVFDIYDPATETFVPFRKMVGICQAVGLAPVPMIAATAFRSVDDLAASTTGKSRLTDRHIREGVVVRTDVLNVDKDRAVLKYVSEAYKLLGGKD